MQLSVLKIQHKPSLTHCVSASMLRPFCRCARYALDWIFEFEVKVTWMEMRYPAVCFLLGFLPCFFLRAKKWCPRLALQGGEPQLIFIFHHNTNYRQIWRDEDAKEMQTIRRTYSKQTVLGMNGPAYEHSSTEARKADRKWSRRKLVQCMTNTVQPRGTRQRRFTIMMVFTWPLSAFHCTQTRCKHSLSHEDHGPVTGIALA